MTRRWTELTPPGWAMVAAAAALFLLGAASIYVTDTHARAGHDGPANAARQGIFLLISVAAGAAVLRWGYQRIGRHAYAAFLGTLALLVPLLIAKMTGSELGGLVPSRRHSYRWINLPFFQVQPSEFMKLAYILALAWYLRFRRNTRTFSGLLKPLALSALPLVLIVGQPDLGTCLMILPVLMTMLFLAGARIKHLLILMGVGLAVAPVLWFQIRPYQQERVASVLLQFEGLRQAIVQTPERFTFLASRQAAAEWAWDSGYQLVASKTAIGSGGLLGYGWGNGPYVERNLLPDRHNDLIFAVVAHQWGLVGGLVVLAAYAVICAAGAVVAIGTRDPFGRLLAVGVTALFATQMIINIGVAVGLMPVTGINLPFVSAGGSSLLTHTLAVALVISVAQHRPFMLTGRPFDFSHRRQRRLKYENAEFGARNAE